MRNHILIPAAGNGFRFRSSLPKQYSLLLGKPVLRHVIDRFAASFPGQPIHVILAADDRWFDHVIGEPGGVNVLRCGGATRAATVANALQSLSGIADDDWIIVHDAVRPCLEPALLSRLQRELACDPVGGLLGVPVADTLKRTDDAARVISTEPREALWQAQTPQMFRCKVLRDAFARAGSERWTDEAQAVEALGLRPRMVEGALTNLKITFPEDLRVAAALLSAEIPPAERKPVTRIGLGQDSHVFSSDPARPLVLGGVEVPGEAGLDGNSDADVVLHALCRALEQAIGKDSFSDYADALVRQGISDSREYVKIAGAHVAEAGYRVNNVGLTIEARRPKIGPLRIAMRASIAELLGIAEDAVGINASTGEEMTPFGKGEGVQAFAIVSLDAMR